jgi:hypothetical protein
MCLQKGKHICNCVPSMIEKGDGWIVFGVCFVVSCINACKVELCIITSYDWLKGSLAVGVKYNLGVVKLEVMVQIDSSRINCWGGCGVF